MAADPRILVRPTPPVDAPAPWKPCPGCWGQRRQFAQGSEGGWYERPCPTCLGIGDVPSVPA